MNKDQDRLFTKDINEASTPHQGLHQIYLNHWWMTKNGKPCFWDNTGRSNIPHISALCNPSRDVVCQLIKSYLPAYEVDAEPMMFPVIYLKIDPRIYG